HGECFVVPGGGGGGTHKGESILCPPPCRVRWATPSFESCRSRCRSLLFISLRENARRRVSPLHVRRGATITPRSHMSAQRVRCCVRTPAQTPARPLAFKRAADAVLHGVDAEDFGPLQGFHVRDPVLPYQLQYSAEAAEMEVIQLPGLHGVDAEDFGPLQGFHVRDPVLPYQLQYSAEAAEMEVIQLPGLVRVDGPGLRSIKEYRQEDGLVHLKFGVQVNTVAIPHGGLQPAEGLTSFGDPLGNLVIDSRVV
ncbi:unnamed protein product, partial [Schistocephalus solidus]|uniref:DnaJ_C domain-containing protein n=1 Tax=Schistocephalus solidus TaxID=70667 RepID=A0A183T423_SCHSO